MAVVFFCCFMPFWIFCAIQFPLFDPIMGKAEGGWDPDDSWHLLGDNAMWQPHIMNRTDLNESSPTYGLWIPPPGTQPEAR